MKCSKCGVDMKVIWCWDDDQITDHAHNIHACETCGVVVQERVAEDHGITSLYRDGAVRTTADPKIAGCSDCPCLGSHYDDHVLPTKYEGWCGYYERVFEHDSTKPKPDFCEVVDVNVLLRCPVTVHEIDQSTVIPTGNEVAVPVPLPPPMRIADVIADAHGGVTYKQKPTPKDLADPDCPHCEGWGLIETTLTFAEGKLEKCWCVAEAERKLEEGEK